MSIADFRLKSGQRARLFFHFGSGGPDENGSFKPRFCDYCVERGGEPPDPPWRFILPGHDKSTLRAENVILGEDHNARIINYPIPADQEEEWQRVVAEFMASLAKRTVHRLSDCEIRWKNDLGAHPTVVIRKPEH